VNREPIAQALFTILAGAYPWQTKSRQGQIWSNVAEQPAMFLIAPSENDQQPEMALTEYKLNYLCLVYFKADPAPDGSAAHPYPDTVINAMIGAIEAKLGTPTGERVQNMQVVGQQPVIAPGNAAAPTPVTNVINCWIDGRIDKDSGILDNQAAILLPIVVLCGI
jgi:hypothetical protein